MTKAVLTGFDLPTLIATAKGAAAPKEKYVADVIAALGPNPLFEIRTGATVVYRAAVAGSLNHSAAGIVFPTQFAEPPSVNVTNGVTNDSVAVLRKATDPNVFVGVPCRVGAPSTTYYGLSKNLDGTAVRSSGIILAPPSSLPSSGTVGGDGSGVWSVAEAEEAVLVSTGMPNESLIKGMNNGNPGFLSGASFAMGNEWRGLDRSWDWPMFRRDDYFWHRYFEWWGILFHQQSSTAAGDVEMKDMDWQIKLKNENFWRRLIGKSSWIGWGQHYKTAGNGYDSWGTPEIVPRAGPGGGVLCDVPLNAAPHFTSSNARYEVPLAYMGNIEGVIATMLIRRAPGSAAGFRPMAHVGGDPKQTNSPSTDGTDDGAYVPFAVSKTINVTDAWRRVTASNVERPGESPTRRHMLKSRFLSIRPLT